MEPEEIKEQIKKEPTHVVGALISLFNHQTMDEAQCNYTINQNNVGFNAFDAKILSDISKHYLKKGFLSDKQIKLVRVKLYKYCNQLSVIGYKPLEIKGLNKEEKKEFKNAEILSGDSIKISFSFNHDTLTFVKNIIGRKPVFVDKKFKYWTCPLTLINTEKLFNYGFKLDSDLAEWYENQTKGITSDIHIPKLDNILRPFQKIAVNFIESKNGRALIADEMGLGKTLESLAWVVYKNKEVLPILIVCPATVKIKWYKEIEKFTDLANQVQMLEGRKPKKIKKPIMIINYDIIFGWCNYIVKNNCPKLMIIDEAHYIKNRGRGFKKNKETGKKEKVILTQRSFGVEEISKKIKYVIGLTGSPANKPKELFNPLKVIKPSLFPTWRPYAYRYCGPKNNGFAMTFEGATNMTELNQILTKEVMLRRRKEDVLKELPEKTIAVVPLKINNQKEYNSAEQNFIQYLREISPKKAKKAARAEALTKINTLIQIAVKGKIKQCIDWIKDFIENDKLVVFTWHQKTIDTLAKAFEKEKFVKIDGRLSSKPKREKAIEQFQTDEETKLLLMQMKLGIGVDLYAASNAAFIEFPWTPDIYGQATDRLHRIGQKYHVTIWNLIAYKTIEENRIKLIEKKAKIVSQMIDGVQTEDGKGIFNELIDNIMERKSDD